MLKLKDGALLRQQCYIDGAWVGADSGATIAVSNPATGAESYGKDIFARNTGQGFITTLK